MKIKVLDGAIAVRLDIGDEICSSLKTVCEQNNINVGVISGLGTTDNAVIGVYNLAQKCFEGKTVNSFCEISNLVGNITKMNGETYLHIHATLGDGEGKVYAGHLKSAVVAATAEIFIIPFGGELNRKYDDFTGLNIFE